jgi:hypothetical protein
MLVWAFHASHAGANGEIVIFIIGWAQMLQAAAGIWLYYLALEPLVRRFWPATLISWTRLLDGRFRDPRLGRDVLVGVLVGVWVSVLGKLNLVVGGWFGMSSPQAPHASLLSLLGPAGLIGLLLGLAVDAIWIALPPFLLLSFLRVGLRSERLAVGVALVFVTATAGVFGEGNSYLSWLFIGLIVAVNLWLMVRFGLLASVACYLAVQLLILPITPDPSAFYFGTGLLVMGLVVALAFYGLFTSQAGRSLFGRVC